MRVLCMAAGVIFLGMSLFGLISYVVSKKARRRAQAMGNRPVLMLPLVVVGLLYLAGGFFQSRWLVFAGFLGLLASAPIIRLGRRHVEDPPPFLARLDAQSSNPLHPIIHPIQNAKNTSELFKLRRNRREFNEWKRHHDLE